MNLDFHFSLVLALMFRTCIIALRKCCPPNYANHPGKKAAHFKTVLICMNAS